MLVGTVCIGPCCGLSPVLLLQSSSASSWSETEWVDGPIENRPGPADNQSMLPLLLTGLVPDELTQPDAATGDDPTAQRGASLVEYALLVALIALVCISAVTLFGTATAGQYSSVADVLN